MEHPILPWFAEKLGYDQPIDYINLDVIPGALSLGAIEASELVSSHLGELAGLVFEAGGPLALGSLAHIYATYNIARREGYDAQKAVGTALTSDLAGVPYRLAAVVLANAFGAPVLPAVALSTLGTIALERHLVKNEKTYGEFISDLYRPIDEFVGDIPVIGEGYDVIKDAASNIRQRASDFAQPIVSGAREGIQQAYCSARDTGRDIMNGLRKMFDSRPAYAVPV